MKLLVEHPYYASETNYFSNEASEHYRTFAEWYAGYHDADIDMNLIVRWDVTELELGRSHSLQIIMIKQRKGIYSPHHIERFEPEDEELAIPLFTKHWKRLQEIWAPISGVEYKAE